MRYRALSPSGDYTFGQGAANFLVNSPDAVAQAILTRLNLWTNQWFLDLTAGTPYFPDIIGVGTKPTYDAAIQNVILGTKGVLDISAYSSSVTGRALSVNGTVDTIYGPVPFGLTFGFNKFPPVITTESGLIIITEDGHPISS